MALARALTQVHRIAVNYPREHTRTSARTRVQARSHTGTTISGKVCISIHVGSLVIGIPCFPHAVLADERRQKW